jgi:gas vesicle protein
MDHYTNAASSTPSAKPSRFMGLLIGMALGMLAMYAMDPRQGKRRRAEAKDKLYSASRKTRKAIDAKSRHFANRAKGMQAKANHLLH